MYRQFWFLLHMTVRCLQLYQTHCKSLTILHIVFELGDICCKRQTTYDLIKYIAASLNSLKYHILHTLFCTRVIGKKKSSFKLCISHINKEKDDIKLNRPVTSLNLHAHTAPLYCMTLITLERWRTHQTAWGAGCQYVDYSICVNFFWPTKYMGPKSSIMISVIYYSFSLKHYRLFLLYLTVLLRDT